jgi:rare lipoprotein A (peptidoglycan hydrolase)
MEGVKALVVLASIYYPGDGIVAKNNYQTSSGERYDQSAPKCAALQWSLGTMLHLVHGRNNIDVTINDHGPYRRGRALDCTPAVDKALHLGGLGSVRVEHYPPLPKARPVEASERKHRRNERHRGRHQSRRGDGRAQQRRRGDKVCRRAPRRSGLPPPAMEVAADGPSDDELPIALDDAVPSGPGVKLRLLHS